MRLNVNLRFLLSFNPISVIVDYLYSQTSQQFLLGDVLFLSISLKLASGFLELSNELQFHAMTLLLVYVVPLLALILHERQ